MIIINKSIEQYKVKLYKIELWINKFLDKVSLDFVVEFSLGSQILNVDRCDILSKLEILNQIKILKLFAQTHSWKEIFTLIISCEDREKCFSYIAELNTIKIEVIRNSSSKIFNYIYLTKRFLSSTYIMPELSAILKEKLIVEKDKVWVHSLISNFDYLKTHKVIDSENHLLNLLVGKDLDLSSLDSTLKCNSLASSQLSRGQKT